MKFNLTKTQFDRILSNKSSTGWLVGKSSRPYLFKSAFFNKDMLHKDDREWVHNVFQVFAQKLNTSYSKVVHAFKTDSMDKLYFSKTSFLEKEAAAEIRKAWSTALSLRHPNDSLPAKKSGASSDPKKTPSKEEAGFILEIVRRKVQKD